MSVKNTWSGKATAAVILGGLLLTTPAALSAAAYSDGFEDADLAAFWTTTAVTYTPAAYSVSAEQVHGGSLALKVSYGANPSGSASACPALYMGHLFDAPVQGVFSVWYYDTLDPVQGGLYVDDYTQWATLGRSYGVWANPDWGYYAALSGSNGDVKLADPSLGWHHYEVTVDDSGSHYRLDGVDLAVTSPLTHVDRLFLYSLVPNNCANPGGYVTYIDDFSYTPLPEPATGLPLAMFGLTLLRRRRG